MRWLKYKIIALVCVVSVFSFTLWYSYYVYVDNTKEADLPLVLAPTLVVIKPRDPGGMIVPDKDKDIYNSMSGRVTDSDKVQVMKDSAAENNLSKAEALALIQKQVKQSVIRTQANIQEKQPIFYIRIAKIKSPAMLVSALQILREKYPQLAKFNGKLYEEKALLSTKYYVHFGPIKELQAAETLCSRLKELNKSCAIFSEQPA